MDLKITFLQDVLPITGARTISADPYTIEIKGKDFRSAIKVIINGQDSPYFVIQSNTSIQAQVPETEAEERIRDVAVISSRFTATERSRVLLQVGDHPQYIEGLQRLVQRFLKLLLRNPGSDILSPDKGGGLGSLISRHVMGTKGLTASDIALSVSRTERQMIQLQANNADLEDSERLAKANLLGVDASEASGIVIPRIEIISQAGATAVSQLEI